MRQFIDQSIVLTTCSPADDPRSLYWARSCAELLGQKCSIVYPGSHWKSFSSGLHVGSVSGVDVFSLNPNSFSRKKMTDVLVTIEANQTLDLIEKLSSSIKPASTPIHRTLVEQCLDEILVGTISLLTFTESRTVIGTDIQGLCGTSVFAESDIKVVYDAQEITTYGFPGLSAIEKKFWEDTEKSLLKENLTAVTVSPGISRWHETKFDFRFEVVPNFEPLRNGLKVSGQTKRPIKFVYYGGCAPEKNLAQLLKVWSVSKLKATLTIVSERNTDRNQLEQLWKSLGHCNSAVEFTSHKDATDVCEFLAQFDVGVLPYDYDYPYSEASPNKFGQYLAAGLAIVANKQGFVSELILENRLGLVLDFSDQKMAADQLALIAEIEIIDEFKMNSVSTFQDQLHWEKNLNFLTGLLAESNSVNRDLSHHAPEIGMMRVRFPVRLMGILKNVSKESVNSLLRTEFGTELVKRLSRYTAFNKVKRFLISVSESRPQ